MARSEITNLCYADIENCVELENNCFSSPWTAEQLKDSLDKSFSIMLKIEVDGIFVGYISSYLLGDELQILNIAIKEEYRGKGYAKKLLLAIEQKAAIKGCKSAYLEVRVSNNAAIKLYNSLNYTTIAKRANFYEKPTEDAYILTKIIHNYTK